MSFSWIMTIMLAIVIQTTICIDLQQVSQIKAVSQSTVKPRQKSKVMSRNSPKVPWEMEKSEVEKKHRYSLEINDAISPAAYGDFLQNHTLEDDFTKV